MLVNKNRPIINPAHNKKARIERKTNFIAFSMLYFHLPLNILKVAIPIKNRKETKISVTITWMLTGS